MVMDESVWFCRLRWTCADEMESSYPIVGGKPGTDFGDSSSPRSTHKGKANSHITTFIWCYNWLTNSSSSSSSSYLLLDLKVLIRRGPNPAEQTGPVRHVVLGTAAVLTSASHRTRSPQEHASEQTRGQEDQVVEVLVKENSRLSAPMASSMNPLYLSGSEFRMSSTEDKKYRPCISATNSTKNVDVPPPPPTAKKSRFSAYTSFASSWPRGTDEQQGQVLAENLGVHVVHLGLCGDEHRQGGGDRIRPQLPFEHEVVQTGHHPPRAHRRHRDARSVLHLPHAVLDSTARSLAVLTSCSSEKSDLHTCSMA